LIYATVKKDIKAERKYPKENLLKSLKYGISIFLKNFIYENIF
jgi:hypothetical protein